MEYTPPKTKDELVEYLMYLYQLYRIRKDDFEEVEFDKIEYAPMEVPNLTDEELTLKAERALGGKHQRDILERLESLQTKLEETNYKIGDIESQYDLKIFEVKERLREDISKAKEIAMSKGLARSSAVEREIASLQQTAQETINELTANRGNVLSALYPLKTSLKQDIDGVNDYFSAVHQAEIVAKKEELILSQEELIRQANEYNGNIDEKKVRYENQMKQTQASLKIRFMEVQSIAISKEELVSTGYYTYALKATNDYYFNMDSLQAYNDFVTDSQLPIFLDHFYTQELDLLKSRALADA